MAGDMGENQRLLILYEAQGTRTELEGGDKSKNTQIQANSRMEWGANVKGQKSRN